MFKKLIGIVALAFTFALSQSAFAHSSCGEGLKNMVESLKLDPAQKEKIKPILDQLKTSIRASADQMKDLRTQMHQQVTSTTMDQGAVDGLIDKKTKLIGDMMKAKMTAKNQIFNILNDQQKTELQNKWNKVEEKWAAKFKECHDDN